MADVLRRRSRQVFAPGRFAIAASCALLLVSTVAAGAEVPVRHKEGLVHGFLVVRTLEGKTIADGDLIQNSHGDRVTSRLVFHFKDGSVHDETAVFAQRGVFRLIHDHLLQRGPSFEHPVEVDIDVARGEVTSEYMEDGKEKKSTERLSMPRDVANGLMYVLLKNIRPSDPEMKVAYVAATPKPRLVQLIIRPGAEDPFTTGDTHRKATHYVVKVDIGGIAGTLASIFGKQPADTHVWILEGEAPAFVKSEGPLAPGGPTWRIELVDPVWPAASPGADEKK